MSETYTSIFYVAFGCLLALLTGRRLKNKTFLATLILVPIVAPALIDQVPRNLAQTGIYLLILAVEFLFPFRPYSFTGDENLKNSALVSFKRCAFTFLKVFIFTEIATWAAPSWALKDSGVPFWAQAVLALLVLDLYQYLCHRAQHRFDFWSKLHKLHHAPEELTVLTTSRSHVLDTMVRQVFGPGLLVYTIGFSADAILYGFLFPSVFLDAFSHANIDFPGKKLRWLGYVFNMPNIHALHHTPDDDRKNYGMYLTIWDHILGTFKMPVKRPEVFGIHDKEYTRLGLWDQHMAFLQWPKAPKLRNERA